MEGPRLDIFGGGRRLWRYRRYDGSSGILHRAIGITVAWRGYLGQDDRHLVRFVFGRPVRYSARKGAFHPSALAVGRLAETLAQIAGLTVVATGSKKNHAHLKELGADHLYDYSDSSVESQIAKDHPADLGLDCFAEGDSTDRLAACFGSKGGRIVTLLPTKAKADKINIEFTLVCVDPHALYGWASLIQSLICTGIPHSANPSASDP